jgi:hypothetical protein
MRAALLVVALALTLVAAATAIAAGARVAGGHSPVGERWTVTASRSAGFVEFQSNVARQPDAGGTTSVPARRARGRCRAFLGTTDYASRWQQIGGPVDRSVVWIDVRLRDGRHFGTAPRPARSRRGHRWLRGFRWTSLFLPPGARAIRARAFDARGRVVTRMRSDRGLFVCR